jgi:UrcA family protein
VRYGRNASERLAQAGSKCERSDEPFPLKRFLMDDQHNETRAARAPSTLLPLSKETAMKTLARTAFRFLQLALVALAGLSVNPQNVARAADPGRDAPPSVKVRISDLDLATPEGTATLYMRIRNAARTVCPTMDIRLLEEKAVWDRCVNEAIANAVTKVGSANLTAYYLARTHRSHALATAQISKPVDPR